MMGKLRHFIYALVLQLVAVFYSYGQLYNFHTYTVEDGLPQTQVNVVCQDRKGNLWIGTKGGGVSRYDGISHYNYTNVNRLVGNSVNCIIEDKKGNIWIGTTNGLSRYNGHEFKNFNTRNGLPSNLVNSICEDNDKNIWVATDEGLCILYLSDSLRGFYKPVKYNTTSGLVGDNIRSVFKDRKGKMWLGTKDGLNIIDFISPSTVKCKKVNKEKGLISNYINDIEQDSSGYMWFATDKGISKLLSKGDGTMQFLNYNSKNGLISDEIHSITATDKGDLWLGGNGGATRILFENNTAMLQLINYRAKSGLAEGIVNNTYKDKEGNIWLSTENGLSKYSGSRFIVYTKDHGLLSNNIWSILEDRDGGLLIASDDGLDKLVIRADTSEFINYSKKYKLTEKTHISALLIDRENNIWLGYAGGVIIRMKPTGAAGNYTLTSFKNKYTDGMVKGMFEDNRGNIWFATSTGLLLYNGFDFKKFTKEDGLASNEVNCLMEDHKGVLWIGTEKGLCSYDGKSFTKYASFTSLKLQVSSIVEDENGNLWLGSNAGGGITRFEIEKFGGDNYTNISEADGLVSNTVYLLMNDNSGGIWVGTNKGIDLFDANYFNTTDSIRIRHFSKDEGFIGIECNQNAVYKDFTGNIWFGTVKGIVKYNPKEDLSNSIEPKTQITALKLINNADFSFASFADSISVETGLPVNLKLPHDQNYLTFNYNGISLTNPDRVRYRYKLEGLSDQWSDLIKETSVSYYNIPPGKYTFYVKACNNNGVWNKDAVSFSFFITPPWYRTPWFYFLAVAFGVSSIWIFITWRTRQLQKSKKYLENKIDERTRELQEKNTELDKLSIVARETINAVAIANPHGEIEWVNESFTKMTGFVLEDLKSQKGNTVYLASANPDLKRIIIDCVATKQSRVYESMTKTKDGRQIWVHTALTPIFDEEGKVRKLVFVDTDITDTKQAEEIIRQKNKDMMDSINYAKLIQDSILPTKEEILKALPESFIFFKPREVVSGDFYWFQQTDNIIYFAVADSTGHGVPGAFMSLIGSTLLNEIVNQKGVKETNKILDQLHEEIKSVLKQDIEGVENRDGMDIALCALDINKQVLYYSGAMRPLYIVNKNKDESNADLPYVITEYAPDKRSIGGDQGGRVATFSQHKIQLKKGDAIYMFTDGYADQFGGPRGKKITNARFKEALLSLQILSMNKQGKLLEKDLLYWMGNHEQVDDILVVGIKI